MKKIFLTLILLLTVFSAYFFLNPPIENKVIESPERDSIVSVNISVVGDLMCHSTQYNYAYVKNDSFNFNPVYNYLRDYFLSPDLMIGNFETVIAKRDGNYKGYPYFNSPVNFLTSLKKNGFDVLFTANNHSLDQNEKGVLRTLNAFSENNLFSFGTYNSKSEKEKIKTINVNGIKLAFAAYSYGTNGVHIPNGKEYLINLINLENIKNDLKKIKSANPDIIIVYYHTGLEYSRDISKKHKALMDSTFYFGADIVLASHPHVILPVEKRELVNSKLNIGFAAHSLGNFISNQRWRYSDAGVILNFQLSKDLRNNKILLNDLSYIPTWVFKGKVNNKKEYVILPSEMALNKGLPNYITANDSLLMYESYFDTKEIVNKLDKSVKLLSVMDSSNNLKTYSKVITKQFQSEYK
ncbi:MAG: CapA family protein [Melioribacteraceae bacterium]|nr:CapA family protein [Melioribacteraceae bacterium]